MDYSNLFEQTFHNLGFEVVGVWNTFDPPYNYEAGWPLKLPDVHFEHNTVLIMHFQDFITIKNGRIIELDRVAEHYGVDACQIVVTHMHHDLASMYDGPINLIEFSNHNYALMNTLARRWDEWKHVIRYPKTMAWQSLNGRMCHHRRRVADVLKDWPNGVLSYGNEIALPEWSYATYQGTDNDENFMRLLDVYGACAVNVITETQYDDYPGVICEKTLLAMLAQQIPIVIGYQGIVQHLRELGFDMFDDVVNHNYDTMPNDVRVEQALLLNKDLLTTVRNLTPLAARLEANREHALHGLTAWYRSNFEESAKKIAKKLLP